MGKKTGWFGRFCTFFSRDQYSTKKKESIIEDHQERHDQSETSNQKVSYSSISEYSIQTREDDSTTKDGNLGAVPVHDANLRTKYQIRKRAATCIQTNYRGYLARKALRALRAVVRLQALVRGQYVRKQALETMRYMQALVRVQDQIRSQRLADQSKTHEEENDQEMKLEEIIAKQIRRHHDDHKNNDNNHNNNKLGNYYERKSAEEQWNMRETHRRQQVHDAASIRFRTGRAHAHSHTATSVHQQPPPQQQQYRASQIQKERPWGWYWLDRWMYHPWQLGLMARPPPPPPPESPYHYHRISDVLPPPEMDFGRLSGHRCSAEYPNRTHYRPPEGLARHSFDSVPNRYHSSTLFPYDQNASSSDGSRSYATAEREVVDMVPSYMATTQSAKAKAVRGGQAHGSVRLQNLQWGPGQQQPSSSSTVAKWEFSNSSSSNNNKYNNNNNNNNNNSNSLSSGGVGGGGT